VKVYFAARFSRLPELLSHKNEIEWLGRRYGTEIAVTSRWLLGGHEWVGVADEDIPVEHNAEFARQDIEDLMAADVVVCFTEPSRSGPARGGRHVEMGYALAIQKPILTVGHRENVFYCLPDIAFVESWEDAKTWLFAYETQLSERDSAA
jgi:Nucleoside 2-deoxyribosyltransferase